MGGFLLHYSRTTRWPTSPNPSPPESSLTRFVSEIFHLGFSRVGKPFWQYVYCVRA